MPLNAAQYTVYVYCSRNGVPDFYNMKATVSSVDEESNSKEIGTFEGTPCGEVSVSITESPRVLQADGSVTDGEGDPQTFMLKEALYKFSFESDETPATIKFFRNRKDNGTLAAGTAESNELEFADGMVYNMLTGEKTSLDEANYNTEYTNYHTIYLADKFGAGVTSSKIRGWGENNDICGWDFPKGFQDTEKCIYLDGAYVPLYSCTYLYYGTGFIPAMSQIILTYKGTGTSSFTKYPGDEHVMIPVASTSNEFTEIELPETLYSPKEHTVYFADRYGWGSAAPEIFMHAQVFLGKTADNKDIVNGNWKGDNQLMKKTGKYVKFGENEYVPVFSYTFTRIEVPTELHFYSSVTTTPIETLRSDFSDDAIYYMSEDKDRSPLSVFTEELIDEADVPETEHTVYFVNKTRQDTRVNIWNGLESLAETNMDQYGVVKEGEEFFPVLKYTFKSKGAPTNLNFKNGDSHSVNFSFIDGNYYYLDGTSVSELDIIFQESYTVYFADKYGWGNQGNTQLQVTVVGDNGNLILQQTEATKKYVKIGEDDSDYYPLFKYTFLYSGTPQTVTFHYREDKHANENSKAAEFVNNKIYYAVADGDDQEVEGFDATDVAQYSKDELPEANHTVYYVDKASVGADKVKVYVWNSEGSLKGWDDSESMQPYKFTEIDGKIYPVYAYNFKMKGAPAKIIFRPNGAQTANLYYHEGNYYYFDGHDVDEIEFADLPTYTVYFADKYNWGAENTHAHVWKINAEQFTAWGSDPKVEDTENFVIVDGNPYRLYKFEFQWGYEPTNIIFQKYNANGSVELQTADDEFHNGKLYIFNPKVENKWQLSTITDLGEQLTYDELPETEHTIYFLDKDNLKAANVRPYIWGNTGELHPWANWSETLGMEGYGKATVDGVNYSVYKYSFTYKGTLSGVILKYQTWNTGDLNYVEGGYYKYDNSIITDVKVEPYPTYTVYFADKYNWGADKTLVHVFSTKGGELSDWYSNDHMIDSEKFVEVGDWAYPLYSYTFRWENSNDPEYIIFHNASSQTPDTEFEDGKLYAYSGVNNDKNFPTEIYDFSGELLTYDDVFEKYGTTIRFADTGRWGVSHTGIHIYDEGTLREDGSRNNQAEYAWGDDPRMTETGKWVRINDLWAPVYEYKTVFKGAWGMNVHAFDTPDENGKAKTLDLKTGDCIIQPDMVYYYAGYNVSVNGKPASELTFYDKIPEEGEEGYVKEGRWIYCHLGANQKYQSAYWVEPHAHFVDRPYDVTLLKDHLWFEKQLPDYRKGEEQAASYAADKMIEVKDMPSVYKIWCEDINKVSEVVFYHFIASRDHKNPNDTTHRYEHYLERPYDMSEHPISIDTSISCENDPTTWASNAFTVGIHCMNQSYLTTEEYLDSWTANPDALYVIGNKGLVPTFESYDNLCDPREGFGVESSEGVYIIPIGMMSADNVVKFKFSLYDVNTIANTKCREHGLSYAAARGWATYNMGALGHDFPGDDLSSDWYKLHIWEKKGSNMSREVHTFVNQTVRFNNYNQYGWRIESGRGGVVAGQPYWLVVDMHPDSDNHRSVTLIEFNPEPELEIQSGKISQRPLSLEEARMLHDPYKLSGAAANGPVFYDKVNEYSVKAQLKEVGTDLLHEKEITVEKLGEPYVDEDGTTKYVINHETLTIQPYNVEYYIYLIYTDENGVEQKVAVDKLVGSQEGVLDISNLVYSPNVRYALRAVYHDNLQNRHFCSPFVKIEPKAIVPDLNPLSVENVEGTIYTYDGKLIGEDDVKAIGGAANFTIPKLTDTDGSPYPYAYFPDIEMTDVVANNENIAANASLIHAGHHIAQQHDKFLMLQTEDGQLPWTPYDESEDYQANNNWSNFIFDAEVAPIFIDRFDTTGVGTKSTKANATFEFTAVYPFLIHDISKEATAEPLLVRRADDSDDSEVEEETPKDLGAYTIFEVRKPNSASATFQGTVTVSAVDNVAIDNLSEDATVEYFSISGLRLATAPTAPGVYIRRCGTKVDKIYVK